MTGYTALMQENGDRTKQRAELIFDRTSGNAVLAKIVTTDAGYSVSKAESANRIASGGKTSTAVRN